MIGQTISHYKILEKLGEGGMGVVYKAEDTKLKRTVALKFLPLELTPDPEAKERFIHEARAAAALSHSNICTIHEIDEAEGQSFIAMEYIEGQDLKDKIAAGPMKMSEALDIATQIAEGLHEAHEKSIVHRDIKPANIMVTTKGQAKIMDFGLAKLKSRARITKPGTTFGTLAYSSPEQVSGDEMDHRSDIFSFGVVLYELLTGRLPFLGDYEAAIVYSIMNEKPQPVLEIRPEIPKTLDEIILKILSKKPDNRYQSMDELRTDLKKLKQDFESGILEKREYLFWKGKRIRKIWWSVVPVIMLIIFIAVMTKFWLPRKQTIITKIPIGVMFFENQTGNDEYDYLQKVLADLLITDISQSRYLQAITLPRMSQLMSSLGYNDVEIPDASMEFEICKLAGVGAMVLPSLSKTGDTFVLNAQVLDTDTKELIASPCRVTGKGEDSILGHLIDDLTDKIKRGLEISIRDIQQEQENITELTTTSLEAYRYYYTGVEAAFRMDHQVAAKNFEKAVALDSTFIEAYIVLARQYYSTGAKRKALETIRKVKSPYNLTEEKLLKFLETEAFIMEDFDLAINYAKKLISINPENMYYRVDLGFLYYRFKKLYDEGISEFKNALQLDPNGLTHYSSWIYSVLGYAYLRKGDYDKAHAAFQKYVDLLPNQAYPLDCLGEFYLIVGNYDQALTALQGALELSPDFRYNIDLLGKTYVAKGMYRHALSSYNRYLDLDIGDTKKAEVHFYLGKLYYLKGDYTKAIQESQQALELNPQMVEAHWIMGLTSLKTGVLDQAEIEAATIEELIEEKESEMLRTYDYHLLGELFLQKGLYQDALENFNETTTTGILERAFFVNALGEAYFKIGEWNLTIETLQGVFEINPNYAQSHYLLGLIYEKKGDREKAREHFHKFLEIWKDADPDLQQFIEVKKRLENL